MTRILFFLGFLVAGALSAQNIDVRLFRAINNAHTPFTDSFFEVQTNSVKPVAMAAPAGLFLTGILRKDRETEHAGILLGTSILLTQGFTHVLKIGFDRRRPYEALANVHTPIGPADTRSFPSGHSSTAFATATMLALTYPKWYVAVPAYTWAGLVGYSRIAVGVHYPSDVIVGALVGMGTSLLVFHFRKTVFKTSDRILH